MSADAETTSLLETFVSAETRATDPVAVDQVELVSRQEPSLEPSLEVEPEPSLELEPEPDLQSVFAFQPQGGGADR